MRIRIQHFMSRILMTKNLKILTAEKIAIYLSLGFREGRPSYRRSLQPSKKEHPALQNMKFFNFYLFLCVYDFCSPQSGSSRPKQMRIHADSDPQHFLFFTV
jgi:hypothetical protein